MNHPLRLILMSAASVAALAVAGCGDNATQRPTSPASTVPSTDAMMPHTTDAMMPHTTDATTSATGG